MQRYYSQYNPINFQIIFSTELKKYYPKIHMETNDHD